MIKLNEFIAFIVLITILSIIAFYATKEKQKIINNVQNAIAECEKSLPRDRECEVVITAVVKELME